MRPYDNEVIEKCYQKPQVTKYGILDMQVCVPNAWTDEEVIDFANANNPSGTENGWRVVDKKRVICYDPGRRACGFVHVMLDC